ncbi:MAG: BON domain-containing protein [Zoogloea sp.]|nr:BON domain-containing protein [Zoogloea sp.]
MIPVKPLAVALLVATATIGITACTPQASRESAGEYVDDATVTARVKTALAQTPNVSVAEVNVETYRGVVQLSGFIDSDDMAQRAIAAAKNVPGVRSVKNDMRIKPAR